MSAFQTVTTAQAPLDPFKRVRYSMGLVLGVDEFEQEQIYLLTKDRLHNRLLHGYGTVCGLAVSPRTGDDGVEVLVSAGVAVDPQGREIRVPTAQCAQIGAWIQNHRAQLEERFGTAPGLLPLYVVLCYRECETDQVPVPGGPCRSQEDSVTASRIADDFVLSLELDPPAQPQEAMTRRFGDLLRRMEIADEATDYLDATEVIDLVRGLLLETGSPPMSPPASPPLPPPETETYYLRPEEACELLQIAFRIWVTEIRPQIMGPGGNCVDGDPEETCVLLAEVQVPLNGSWQINGDVIVDDAARPLLANTRLLQEWLLCGQVFHRERRTVHDFASLATMSGDTLRIWIHHPTLIDLTEEALLIEVNGSDLAILELSRVVEGTNVFDARVIMPEAERFAFWHQERVRVSFATRRITAASDPARTLYDEIVDGQIDYVGRQGERIVVHEFANLVSDHGQLDGLEDDDHPQYFNQERGDERYALRDHTHDLGDLRNVTEDGRQEGTVLAWNDESQQWEPREPQAGPDEHEHRLDDLRDVNAPEPVQGSLLAFDGNQWVPQPESRPQNGSVLTWQGNRWEARRPQQQPQPEGNFVLAPLPQYAIIAAGIFGAEGEPRFRPYNDLEAIRIATGRYLLRFPGYVLREDITYIVKGTIIEDDTSDGDPGLFLFSEFSEEGLIVRTYDARQTARFAERAFMVEISVYGEDLSEIFERIG